MASTATLSTAGTAFLSSNSSAPTLGKPPLEAGLVSTVFYYAHQYWIDVGDPRTADYPMVSGGAWKIAAVLLTYWMLVKKILPAFMANRQPYSLVNVIRVYNTIMVLVNAAFFIILVQHIDWGRRFLDFNYPDRADTSAITLEELSLCWYGYMSRYLDMVDTIFFVLRKKHNQITLLHVYHHMVVPFLGWFSFKLNPLIPIIGLFGLFNSVIHVIMYSYYSLASFGPKMQKFLWWKKYITQLQLLQFAACGTYGIFLYNLQQGYPMIWFWLAVGQNPIFFYMFYDFYVQAYKKKAAAAAAEKSAEEKKTE